MSTNVYIDGFNFYHGAVKNTPYKWLDLGAMCQALLPGRTINKIRYFTAIVKGFKEDPGAPRRQQVYIRALETLPQVTVHRDGWFSAHPVLLPQFPLAYRFNNGKLRAQCVQVQKMEEKRTDVDLATWLLVDCFDSDFDEAVIISNDSDLVLPISMVRTKFGKPVVVVNPHSKNKMSGHLVRAASSHLTTINPSVLRACQFPDPLADARGAITKPMSW